MPLVLPCLLLLLPTTGGDLLAPRYISTIYLQYIYNLSTNYLKYIYNLSIIYCNISGGDIETISARVGTACRVSCSNNVQGWLGLYSWPHIEIRIKL